MGVSSSLFSSISGLNTMGEAMSVLGDNVANVNTIAFKSSRASFQDVLSQSVSTAAGSAQVGRGVTLATVDGLFAQGSFESSSTPTDMAIGGQGFFMLRAADNAEASMFSRAGQFRFDQEGNLVNPTGAFVQGWTLETTTGERQGTIGDIQIGKSTPPTPTERIEVITNVDARVVNESNETRLFDAWDARNAASVNPTPPITSSNYDYTTAIKVFDSKGASHDVTVFFDRTTKANQWEFLVTVNPQEDMRAFTEEEKLVYPPYESYNFEDPRQKGVGALMYGTIDYSTSGAISAINAWNVPPDGKVEPAQNTNRITLDTAESYYSFPVNFTGDTVNSPIQINFGARYTGLQTGQNQVLVSDLGAFANSGTSAFITKETLMTSVYDLNGNALVATDSFTISGYNNLGVAVGPWTYTVTGTDKVGDFLTALGGQFSCNATVDSLGRLKLTDLSGGVSSGFYISNFTTTAISGANPFGAQINIATSKEQIVSPGRALSTGGGTPPVISAGSNWGSVFDSAGAGPVAALDSFTFTGFSSDGVSVVDTFTVDATDSPNDNVQDLLTWLESAFQASAEIDGAGRLVLTDRTSSSSEHSSALAISSVAYGAGTPTLFGPTATSTFATIPGDSSEDGSRQGTMVSSAFEPEALGSTQYANSSTTIFQDQNGFASGFLQSVSVDTDGIITGAYSNGQVLRRAQVALATFNNLDGLFKEGGNIYSQTTKSGAPITGAPGTNGLGSIAPNALEQSNVDIGTEFVRLITTQRGFQANSKIITTVDEMLTDLINIKR